jgi:hypothetical protein
MSDNSNALNLHEMFSTNKDSEENGIWFELSDVTGFKIRAIYAKAVVDLREKLMKPFVAITRAGMEIPADKNEKIGLEVLAGAILADWKGVKLPLEVEDPEVQKWMKAIPKDKIVTDANGFHEYNPEVAYAMVRALPRLASYIASQSTETQNYQDEQREEGAKNS